MKTSENCLSVKGFVEPQGSKPCKKYYGHAGRLGIGLRELKLETDISCLYDKGCVVDDSVRACFTMELWLTTLFVSALIHFKLEWLWMQFGIFKIKIIIYGPHKRYENMVEL